MILTNSETSLPKRSDCKLQASTSTKYDFLGSEGSLIKYSIPLTCTTINTTLHFTAIFVKKNFNWKCMIGSIGCIITNLEYSICAKLLPSRCQATITDNFERLSSEFISIPPLLTIEIGHLSEPSKLLLLSEIDTEFTISHGEKVLRYELSGLSIHLTNQFYSFVRLKDDFTDTTVFVLLLLSIIPAFHLSEM